MAHKTGYGSKKLMIATGRAAKGKGPLPPQLWKFQTAQAPNWGEFDRMDYREIVVMTALKNVYDVVKMWASGQAVGNQEAQRFYARLVGDGIVGKDI